MKHLLYFGGYRMVVLRWNAGTFTGAAEFEPNDKGYAAFERLARQEMRGPVRLLVDLIEEDFRLETAPHLIGRDRAALHKRLINRYFRLYPHTRLKIQERQKQGRRDDIVQISALTNSKLFEPWLEILERARVPLQGIYSLPVVGEQLLKPLGAEQQNALVINQQVPGSIRQSFYARGALKLTRLAPSGDNAEQQCDVIQDETQRTVRYLENQQYVDTRQKLHIYVIAPGGEHELLQQALHSDSRKEYHIVDKDRLGFDMGIKGPVPGRYVHWIFAHLLLGGKHYAPHYGTHKDRRYYYHFQARRALHAAATLGTIAAVLWSGSLAFDMYMLSVREQQMRVDAMRYTRGYEDIVRDISELNLDVNDVRDVVNLAEKLEKRYGATPEEMIEAVSRTLGNHPNIRIKNIKWVQTHDANHSFGETSREIDSRTSYMMKTGQIAYLYRKGMIEATVTDYGNNPRLAVEAVDRFIRQLRDRHEEYKVELIKTPYDIDPESRLVGRALSDNATRSERGADFAFVLSREIQL